jgi:hypothetical protein
MKNILYLIAVLLIMCWGIGFLAYNASALIHILLVIAFTALLLRAMSGDNY